MYLLRALLMISCLSSPVLAQPDETMNQRTVEGANRFLGLLVQEYGSLFKFNAGGAYAQVDVNAVSVPAPCVTRLTFAPGSLYWEKYSQAQPAYRPPEYVDIKWGTASPVQSQNLARSDYDPRTNKTLWGIKFWLDPTTNLKTSLAVHWGFGTSSEMVSRIVAASEFLREKCQFQSDTGF